MSEPIKTTFGTIKSKCMALIGPRADLIPLGTTCIEVDYEYGDAIASTESRGLFLHAHPLKNPLALILEGRAEIYQEYKEHNFAFLSYRPIRVLDKGEIIGDFAIIDDRQGLNDYSIEDWKICSGYRCFLLKSNLLELDSNKTSLELFMLPRSYNFHDHTIYSHLFFNKERIDLKTKIVFIDSSFVTRHDQFYNWLIDYSWSKVKIYRDSVNSYNYVAKLKYRDFALSEADTKFKNFKVNERKIIIPLFIDMLWDALNRPIRGEPVFAVDPNLPLSKLGIEDIEIIGLKREDILSAMKEPFRLREFWFPLDHANYILTSYCENNKLLGKNLSKYWGGIRDRDGEKGNMREFFIALTNHLLEILPPNNFNVECIETDGGLGGRRHILLHFTQKRVQND